MIVFQALYSYSSDAIIDSSMGKLYTHKEDCLAEIEKTINFDYSVEAYKKTLKPWQSFDDTEEDWQNYVAWCEWVSKVIPVSAEVTTQEIY